MANANVEQFHDFSSALFSRIMAKKITSPSDYSLTAKEQDEVIKDKAAEYFARIEKMPRGDEMKVFLLKMMDFCKKQTFTDSYSYRTVSGFAVNDDFGTRRQKKNMPWHKDPENARLIELLRTLVAYNLLTLKPDELQGKKGQLWSVFYLNYALCVYAGIPLNYGGWREALLTSKLLALGVLLIGLKYENEVQVYNVNSSKYDIADKNRIIEANEHSEPFLMWINGEPYV